MMMQLNMSHIFLLDYSLWNATSLARVIKLSLLTYCLNTGEICFLNSETKYFVSRRYLVGGGLAVILRREWGDVIAIAIETGVQNTGLSIFALRFSLPQPEAGSFLKFRQMGANQDS